MSNVSKETVARHEKLIAELSDVRRRLDRLEAKYDAHVSETKRELSEIRAIFNALQSKEYPLKRRVSDL